MSGFVYLSPVIRVFDEQTHMKTGHMKRGEEWRSMVSIGFEQVIECV